MKAVLDRKVCKVNHKESQESFLDSFTGCAPYAPKLKLKKLKFVKANLSTAPSNLKFEALTSDHPGHQLKHSLGKLKFTQSLTLSTALAN